VGKHRIGTLGLREELRYRLLCLDVQNRGIRSGEVGLGMTQKG
jgi:hypothetical protein